MIAIYGILIVLFAMIAIWHLNSSVALFVGFHDKRMVVLLLYLASCFVVLPQHVNDPLDLDTIQHTGISYFCVYSLIEMLQFSHMYLQHIVEIIYQHNQ